MSPLWTEEMSTDIQQIDQDHRTILQQIYHLRPALDGPRVDAHRVSLLLRDLERYVIEHVAQEEEELWDADYPEVFPHIAEHARLTEYLAGMREELAVRGPDLVTLQRSTRMLSTWIVVHINSADQRFAKYLRDCRDQRP
ncbi:MAG: hemerythrin domain-containing protein [Deltaproteobacteria bacterium]|jgi:hemerythrin-like metal-binding protein|nr:hemerythrin domain-containing protein [Deltaproteobacteria bacterium]MBW2534724.1 hemerythrin domain-containing protein [Deltaproteobacteria bacterium]